MIQITPRQPFIQKPRRGAILVEENRKRPSAAIITKRVQRPPFIHKPRRGDILVAMEMANRTSILPIISNNTIADYLCRMSQPVLPLCAFPPVHWFQSALSAPSFIIDTTENYPKQTCRNRYDILGANGKLSLTIPIVGQKGQKVPTSEIIIHQEPWRKSHWISLQSAYKRSAYFEHYEDIISPVFSTQTEKLVDFNLLALMAVSKALKLETNYTYASSYLTKEEIGAEADFRDDFEPSFLPKSQTPYLQVFSDRFAFQSGLSILDLLFNLGPKTVDHILLIKNSKV